MRISAIHLSKPTSIRWRGKNVKTGIYKVPVNGYVRLTATGAEGDFVADRKHHGGWDKAFYTYPSEYYPYWRQKFSTLDLPFGMFGENLTTQGLFENEVRCGTLFRLGGGLVKAIQPRQPCFKLGVKFGTQKVITDFIEAGYPGIYFQVLEPCVVDSNASFEMAEDNPGGPLISELFSLLYYPSANTALVRAALNSQDLPESTVRAIAVRQGMI